MPRFFIRTVNASFRSEDNGADYDEVEDAMRAGVAAAMAITAGETRDGSDHSSVEVIVSDYSGRPVQRSVVTLCVATLMVVA